MQTNANNSKALAIITYITLIGWIIAFALNNKQKNLLVSYHQRQSLGIQLIYFSTAFLISLTTLANLQVLFLGVFILMIIGISNASNQKKKPFVLLCERFQSSYLSFMLTLN